VFAAIRPQATWNITKVVFMSHPCREYAKKVFSQNLPGALARNCERNVMVYTMNKFKPEHATFENQQFRTCYKNKIMCMVQELKRAPVVEVRLVVHLHGVSLELSFIPQLAYRLKNGFLESSKFAYYPPDILWQDGPFARMKLKLLTREMEIEAVKKNNDNYVGMFQCSKCKSKKTTYYQMQTRSADEPATSFVTCMNCSKRWKC
jgi:hypothetical protein